MRSCLQVAVAPLGLASLLAAQPGFPEFAESYGDSAPYSFQLPDGARAIGSITVGPTSAAGFGTCTWVDGEFVDGSPTIPSTSYSAPLVWSHTWSVNRISEDLVLVSGSDQNASAGKLALVRFDRATRVVSIESSATLPGLYPVEVLWDSTAGAMFLLEEDGGRVSIAPWSGPGAALPDVFLGIRDTSARPIADDMLLIPGAMGVAFRRSSGLALRSNGDTYPKSLKFDGGGWVLDEGVFQGVGVGIPVFVNQNTFEVQTPSPFGHADSIEVSTTDPAAGGAFDVVSLSTGFSVHSGTIPSGQAVTVAGVSEFWLEPGQAFQVSGPGAISSQVLRPTIRYGEPTTQIGSLEMDRGIVPPTLAFVDSPTFGVATKVRRPGPAVDPEVIQLGVSVAFRLPEDTEDPLVAGSSSPVLLAGVTGFTELVRFASGEVETIVDMEFPIPSLQSLDGTVVLFQLLLADSDSSGELTDLVVSDVFGTKIRGMFGSAFTTQSTFGVSLPSQSASEFASQARSSWSSQIQSHGGFDWVQEICELSMQRQRN